MVYKFDIVFYEADTPLRPCVFTIHVLLFSRLRISLLMLQPMTIFLTKTFIDNDNGKLKTYKR